MSHQSQERAGRGTSGPERDHPAPCRVGIQIGGLRKKAERAAEVARLLVQEPTRRNLGLNPDAFDHLLAEAREHLDWCICVGAGTGLALAELADLVGRSEIGRMFNGGPAETEVKTDHAEAAAAMSPAARMAHASGRGPG